MDNDKRKLTEKELKRKDYFEKLNSEMQQKGYQIKNMIINIQQANYLGPLIMLPFSVLIFWIYYMVLRVKSSIKKITLPYGFMVSLSYHT